MKFVIASGIAIVLSTGVLSAQSAQSGSDRSTNTSDKRPAVLTGCVYEEKNVPGRAPNPAERVGILDDYILVLTDARSGDVGTAGATGTSGVIGDSQAPHKMYKLEKVSSDHLSTLVGKRVEVNGRIDADPGDYRASPDAAPQTSQTDRVIGHDRIDIAEFEVDSIREVSGTCPATPADSSRSRVREEGERGGSLPPDATNAHYRARLAPREAHQLGAALVETRP